MRKTLLLVSICMLVVIANLFSQTTLKIFQPTDVPGQPLANDGGGIQLGVKFRSILSGHIAGIRFYKGTGTTGTHTGQLYSSSGSLLAQATFTNESSSGWQEVLFTTPVAISANTTYIASFHSSSGDYAFDNPYFSSAVVNGPLKALANGEDGVNGLFEYSSTPVFPTSNYNSGNYWVDVAFIPPNSISGTTNYISKFTTANTIGNSIIYENGSNIGVGTTSPAGKFTVATSGNGDGIWVVGSASTNVALLNNVTTGSWNPLSQAGDNLLLWKGTAIDSTNAGGLVIAPWSNSNNGIRISSTGNVGIGTVKTADAAYKLFVELGIRTRKIKVDQATWADYVFDNDYNLPTLAEVEKYIRKHKHLPDIPSAQEVEKDGLNLGDNQALLLKKIEELTLYLIEQNKKLEEQMKENQEQQKRINQLEQQLKILSQSKR
jgi:hypothetical protein